MPSNLHLSGTPQIPNRLNFVQLNEQQLLRLIAAQNQPFVQIGQVPQRLPFFPTSPILQPQIQFPINTQQFQQMLFQL